MGYEKEMDTQGGKWNDAELLPFCSKRCEEYWNKNEKFMKYG